MYFITFLGLLLWRFLKKKINFQQIRFLTMKNLNTLSNVRPYKYTQIILYINNKVIFNTTWSGILYFV